MKNPGSYFLFIAVLVFGSCKDDDFLNKVVLDKIVYHENVDQVGQFTYSSDGQLQQYQYYFDNNLNEIIEFSYSGQILKSKKYYTKQNSTDTNPDFLVQIQLFSHKPNEEIAKAYLDRLWEENTIIYSFTSNNGEITKVVMSDGDGNLTDSFDSLQYDPKGNVIKRFHYLLEDDVSTLNYIIEYEYDNKNNPLFDFNDPIDLLTSIPNNISPNNVVKMVQRSSEDSEPYSTTEIGYTYNEFDLPVEKNEKTNLDGHLSESIVKFYYKRI